MLPRPAEVLAFCGVARKLGQKNSCSNYYRFGFRLCGWSFNLGNVYFSTNKFDKAAQEYTSALEFERNDADIFVNLCKTQLALNDKLSARRTWEAAIKLRSDVEETYGYMKEDLAR